MRNVELAGGTLETEERNLWVSVVIHFLSLFPNDPVRTKSARRETDKFSQTLYEWTLDLPTRDRKRVRAGEGEIFPSERMFAYITHITSDYVNGQST